MKIYSVSCASVASAEVRSSEAIAQDNGYLYDSNLGE